MNQCGVSLKFVFTVRVSVADETGFEKTIMKQRTARIPARGVEGRAAV